MKNLLASITTLFTVSDEQAMWRVHTQDDPHAFAQLMERWEVPIQRLCTRMLGDEHRGQDLAQDTFARLFAKRKEYQPTGRFSTYLWRIALNLCYDELRRRNRRPETPLQDEQFGLDEYTDALMGVDSGPDVLLSREEEGALIRRAVLQLSETYRGVVVLRHYENLKFREIAEVLGIPEGTVKSRMAEALSQLQKILSHVFQKNNSVICKSRTKARRESLVL